MKKRTIIYSAISVSFLALLVAIVVYIMFWRLSDTYYADKLIDEIREEDIEGIEEILKTKPTCINTYPSIAPEFWHSVMDERVTYALTEACITDNIDIVEMLIAYGADVNCNSGITPLSMTYRGKRENWYKISLLLIENGVDINYSTYNHGNSASVLVDITYRTYTPDSEEEVISAFNYAIENCDHSKVEWGRVLQHSVSYDRIEIVKFLLDEGYCDVNDPSMDMTALMFAARDSDAEMVRLLLAYGADKYAVDENGKTAYDLAKEFAEDRTILSLLE